ncbi:MAG: hypothetical protein IKZ19_08190, partial [Clostridia bacterium]|nr:hypothetical protein [Clostridia bacterium]
MFLALVMILLLFPANILAVPENVLSQDNDYSYYVGGTAKFNPELLDGFDSVYISDDPSKGWNSGIQPISIENYIDLMVVIDEVYKGNDGLWVKVSAAVGHTLPEVLVTYPWILQNEWNSSSYPNTFIITPPVANQGYLTVTDGSGNIVTGEFTLPMYEKPTLTANSSLAQITSDVEYQWQIEYEEGKWVDIYGETGRTLKLSYGMVATLLNDDGEVDVRCASFAGAMTAYGEPITVTIEMYQPEEPDVVVSESFTTSSGNTVTVTVAGSLPEDSSVALLETDASGVDVAEGETVVAALDISIKNADGTEWQPESGETVTVTLGASSIGLENGDEFVVYHLHNGVVKLLGSFVVADNTVSFEVDGFSKFIFALTSSAQNGGSQVETPDFSGDIGKYAHITYQDVWLFVTNEEPNVNSIEEAAIYSVADFSTDFALYIEDYRVVTEPYLDFVDVETSDTVEKLNMMLWYQVKVVRGSGPEDFVDHCWVFQNALDEEFADEYDALTFFDEPLFPEVP